MIITHLAVFSFYDGASGYVPVTVDAFAGYITAAFLWAFDGFSGATAETSGTRHMRATPAVTRRRLRRC